MRTMMMGLALVAIASLVASCGNKGISVGEGRGDAVAATDTGGVVGLGGFGAGGVATGGAVGSGGIERGEDGGIGGTGGGALSSILGKFTVPTDCGALLDYRPGCGGYSPAAASVAALAPHPCPVPWNPSNPKCPRVTPPIDCPGGPIPVGHSCIRFSCQLAACAEGTCALKADLA